MPPKRIIFFKREDKGKGAYLKQHSKDRLENIWQQYAQSKCEEQNTQEQLTAEEDSTSSKI